MNDALNPLFREEYSSLEDKLSEEQSVVPFYDRTKHVEEAIFEFLSCDPSGGTLETKSLIMTLFEPTGTGKTTIMQQIPMIYTNVYRISIPFRMILASLQKQPPMDAWFELFTRAIKAVSNLSAQNKSTSISTVTTTSENFNEALFSKTVREKLGQDAVVFLHIDGFQFLSDTTPQLLEALYKVCPYSKNIKVIVSGSTALGNDKIGGVTHFHAIPCPPLHYFGTDRVHLVLSKVLYWEELKIEGKTTDETIEIKNRIENALTGTPKCILYFLQSLFHSNKATLLMKEEEINNILHGAYNTYTSTQNNMLEQLLGVGLKYSKIEETNLFEKIVMIFTFPEEFGLERGEHGLIGDDNNGVIKLLAPFNRSGLTRIYKPPSPWNQSNVILSIPNNFTKRYIQENTLYFPKEWLEIFNATCCGTASNISENVKGYSIQIWLAILLLNQHSTLNERIIEMVKEGLDLELYEICYENNVKRNTFTTFEGLPSEQVEIDGPKIAHDGTHNSCVDVIIPWYGKCPHKSTQQKEVIPLFVQITCMKSKVSQHARNFFDNVSFAVNSRSENTEKKELYTSCIAIFITVHSMKSGGKATESVKHHLERNTSFLLFELDSMNLFQNMDFTKITEVWYLQQWIQTGNIFMNVINQGSQSPPRLENWGDNSSSPNGGSTKKQKQSITIGSSHMHSTNMVQSSTVGMPVQNQTNYSSFPILQRYPKGAKLIVGKIELNISNPKGWNDHQLREVLKDTSEDGVGLTARQFCGVEIVANHFESVIDALIGFEGKKEEKIDHAKKILHDILDKKFSGSDMLVRWIYHKMLKKN